MFGYLLRKVKGAVRSLWKWAYGWLRGGPHVIIGDKSNPYLYRWYIIPRNPLCNVYCHKFMRDDDDRARHDHPWASLSLLLVGQYIEDMPGGVRKLRRRGALVFRRATHVHRIELPEGKPAWTLFLTGPKVREWGFTCPQGWRHWRDFVRVDRPGEVGRGCED